VTGKAYRIAYDNGFIEGLALVSTTASKEMRKQRERMARS
jgi:hypothetical protein